MRTGGELSGLAVVAQGERLGRVQDVLFEPSSGRLTGFLITGGGLFARPQFLPRLMVRSLGSDALVVEDGTQLQEVKGEPVIENSVTGRSLDDRPVINEAGKLLGKVVDVVVDESALKIAALVLGTGFFDNMFHGKPHLPLEQVKVIGGDSVVASSAFDPHAETVHAGPSKAAR